MNLKLDMAKFKKVASDKKSTTMRHQDGHEMVITHHALSPKMRAQLHALPMHKGDDKEKSNPKLEESKKQPEKAKKMADGGSVSDSFNRMPKQEHKPKMYAEDSPDTNRLHGEEEKPSAPTLGKKIGYPGMAEGGDVKGKSIGDQIGFPKAYAEGGITEAAGSVWDAIKNAVSPQGNMAGAMADQTPQQITQEAAQRAPAMAAPEATPQSAPQAAPMAPQMAQEAPAPSAGLGAGQAPAQALSDSLNTEGNILQQGYEQKTQGLAQEAQDEGNLARQQAETYQKALGQQQQSLDSLTQEQGKTKSLIDDTIQDYKEGHIDPKHFTDNMGTGSKISSAIGLILGGIGGGLTHQENPAMKVIQSNIDRDIDSQRANIANKSNLLGVLSKHMGDVNDAAVVSKNILAGVTADNLASQAAKMQPGILRDQAMQKAADLKMMYAPQLQQMTLKRAAANAGAGNDPEKMIAFLRVTNPEMAKEMESRYVPQVGLASVPVPQEVRGTLVAKQQLGNMAKDFYSWAQKHSGSLDPKVVNEGKTKAAELQSLYRNSINGGVFKKGEQEFIDQIVDSDPTKFFNNLRVLPKIKEVIQSNDQQLNTLKSGYGLPAMKSSPLPEIRNQNGIPHQKITLSNGQTGWLPVKR